MTVQALRAWLQQAPAGTLVSAAAVLEQLEGVSDPIAAPAIAVPTSWRERLWVVPGETRLGVTELMEALGRPRSWVHRHTSKRSGLPQLPHRKLDGSLVFVAGEIRTWLQDHEVRSGAAPGPALVRQLAARRRLTTR
jgi:predicted DNA-binding transcriptional regulator AlpA